MSESFPPAVAPESSSIDNPFERIVGVFVNPVETFRSIAKKPDWVVPLLVIIVFSIVSAFLIGDQLDLEGTIREQMSGSALSEQQREAAVEGGVKVAKFMSYMGAVFLPLMILIIAAVMMLGHKLMGGAGTFAQYFSTTVYAWFPQTLLSLILTVILMFSEPMTVNTMLTAAYSNPAFLLEREGNVVLWTLLTKLDVFTIWSVALMVVGYSTVAGFSRARSAAVVVALWILYIAISLIGPLMQGAVSRRS